MLFVGLPLACMAVRDTKGRAAAWSKDTLSGMVASKSLLIVAYSAYVPESAVHKVVSWMQHCQCAPYVGLTAHPILW